MANLSTDQQILQLIQIKLGLEQKSQKIFKQLLRDDSKDPLNQLFKSIVSKNRKIESLKLELEKSRAQIDKLQKKLNPSYKSTTNANQERSKSLPDHHESKMKSIGEDKRKVESDRNKYREKVESFIVFLMKCIREISRDQSDGLDFNEEAYTNLRKIDAGQIQKRIKTQIKKHQQLIFQTQMQREVQTQSITTGTTRESKESRNMENKQKQKQDLHRLIKEIKGNVKGPEQMFEKIHKALGLQEEWKDYIGKLNEQIDSFEKFKQFARIEEQKIQQQGQRMGLDIRQQMDNQQGWKKSQWAPNYQQNNFFFNRQIQSVQPAKKFNINLWDIDVCKISQKINYEQQQHRFETMFSQTLKKTDRQLNQLITHFDKTLNTTLSKIFQLFNALLDKHNQFPLNIRQSNPNNGNNRKQINCQQFMRNNQWNDVERTIFKEIQDRFKFIQRRVKFYSANRCVLRNSVPEP